ncbi:MAG: hypothetical protein HQL06_11305 [Nitrospirae bacterium]|nr:hypothetical protein [Nitrospirota bacterium]
MKVAIVHEEVTEGYPDTEDVLEEIGLITESLSKLDYDYSIFQINDCKSIRSGRDVFNLSNVLSSMLSWFEAYNPDVIFNMVEGNKNTARLFPALTAFFELTGLPVTGSPYDVLSTTTDKVLAKSLMMANCVQTPPAQVYAGRDVEVVVGFPCIVKPSLEDGSVGIDDNCVVYDEGQLNIVLRTMYQRHNRQRLLIEQYIKGREFNVSIIEREEGIPEAFPVAEILFNNWPVDKPRIVSYKAKWDEGSFEYDNTPRMFNAEDVPLKQMKELALRCWDIFSLRGYARADLRMDISGNLHVIEINANPCIAHWSGFVAAAKEHGYSEVDVIRMIIDAALQFIGKALP